MTLNKTDLPDENGEKPLIAGSRQALHRTAAQTLIARMGADFRYLFVNQAYAENFGFTVGQVIGRRIPEVIGEAAFQTLRPHIENCLAGEELTWEEEVPYHNIGVRYMRVFYTPERGEGGNVQGLFAVIHDITQEKQTERQLRVAQAQHHLFLDNIDEAVMVYDRDWRVTYANRKACEMSQMRQEDMLGRTEWELFPGIEDKPTTVLLKQAKEERKHTRIEDYYAPLDVWYETNLSPLSDGGVVVFTRDITQRKKAEEALRERQSEVEALNSRLQRAMQETHHRIKNNLQVIAALVEMQGAANASPGEMTLRRINTHITALATIHDLLTQQAKGDADLNDLDAGAMLNSLIPMLQDMAEGRRIRSAAETVTLPVQQAAALALLVNELVSNAIKHAAGDIEITLSLPEESLSDRSHPSVRLEVCDYGPGFPHDFDPHKAANTGLELIDGTVRWDLKGEVRYQNGTQGGGCVVVTFPLPSALKKMRKAP
jgi:PAS domain S-box-containing protein